MRITEVRLQRVRLPLVHDFRTSSHRKSSLEHILVRVRTADGGEGWGEIASPLDPYYSGETTAGCFAIARDYLAPMLLGLEWEHPDEVATAFARVRGNGFAKAGVEAAAWVVFAGSEGISLADAFGGTRTSVSAGVSLGIEPTVDDLLEQVAAQVESGYRRVKLKVAPGWDVVPAREVQAAFPDIALQVDANGAYQRRDDHLAALLALDELDLQMIEQPFGPRELVAHADLQKLIRTPVCLDESIETVGDLESAIRLDAGRIVNLKTSRMGGPAAVRAAHDLAVASGLPVWCGGMHEFGVGRAINVAIASLPGFTLTSDVSGSSKYYARDVTTEPVVAIDGKVAVPASVGLGFEVDEQFVTDSAIDSVTLS